MGQRLGRATVAGGGGFAERGGGVLVDAPTPGAFTEAGEVLGVVGVLGEGLPGGVGDPGGPAATRGVLEEV